MNPYWTNRPSVVGSKCDILTHLALQSEIKTRPLRRYLFFCVLLVFFASIALLFLRASKRDQEKFKWGEMETTGMWGVRKASFERWQWK